MVLSEYEEQRLRNISANQEILASLGLDEATRKRERPEQSRQPRAPQPRQQKCALHNPTAYGSAVTVLTLTLTLTRTRVSFRHHGLEPDADAEEVDQAMQVAAAQPATVTTASVPPPLLLLHHPSSTSSITSSTTPCRSRPQGHRSSHTTHAALRACLGRRCRR
tara:strand:+ start:314 stop:805 length:492 start_codon:yes stop_codon:yes gene_type:complete